MAAQRQVPGGPFVNETDANERQIPGSVFINESQSAAPAVPLIARQYGPDGQRSMTVLRM